MKRRLIALGVISPLLLLVICAAITALGGAALWFLISPAEKSRIIRIMPLAPLSTPAAAPPPAASQNPDQPPEPVANGAAPAAGPGPADEVAAASNETSLTPEEINQALGFSLPAGSVNSITQNGVATRLVIPKLKLDRSIIISPIKNQTWQVDHLDQAVGHLEGTAPPGSNSNLVLAAHVTLEAGIYGPFAGLAQLAPGDVIFVYSGQQKFEYVVDGYQTVERTSVEVTYPSDSGQVTLITCNNWNQAEGRYDQRLVVKGHLVEG